MVVCQAAFGMSPDADLGNLYSFLDIQHMRRVNILFYGNLIIFLVDILLLSGIFRWKRKTEKNVCDIRTDDQQKMDLKRASAFWHSDGLCDLDDVLRFYMKDGILYSVSVYGSYTPARQ